MSEENLFSLHIAIVGPCAAGKSTLAGKLSQLGLHAKQIAQEHSYIPSMWKLLTNPDVLIYLEVSFEVASHRKSLNWRPQDHQAQRERLKHARKYCHVYIQTDDLTPDQVLARVLEQLEVGHFFSRDV